MFVVKAMLVPGSGNGVFNVAPDSPNGEWRSLVMPGCPLGGGYQDTGWYTVEEYHWDCWEEAAGYIGSFVWTSESNEADDDLARGEAILREYGYELTPSLAEVRPVAG